MKLLQAAVLVALAIAATATAAPASAKPMCGQLTLATGTPAAGPGAKGTAITAWSSSVSATYGAAFAIWANARRQAFNCVDVTPRQLPGSPPLVKIYRCTAAGEPCKP